jgi:hypothetical protein
MAERKGGAVKTDPRRSAFLLLIALFLLLACVLPGGAAPTAGPDALSTIIAGTAAAAAAQTELAAAGEAALSAPTLTATPTQAPIAGAAGDPVFSLYETALVQQADGSSLLIDRKGGYQVLIPAGWTSMRVNEPEYYAAFASEAAATPIVHEILTNMQNENLDVLRLAALDTRPGHIVDGIPGMLAVGLYFNELRTLEDWDEYESDNPRPYVGFKVLGSSFQVSAAGLRYLVREYSWSGRGETIYEKAVFFSVPAGTVSMEFDANIDFKDALMAEFGQVIDSLTLLVTQ